jgi:hypothetical protein
MVKPVTGEPKKPYAAPVLTVHGTVSELTKSNQTGGKSDGGTRGFRVRTSL